MSTVHIPAEAAKKAASAFIASLPKITQGTSVTMDVPLDAITIVPNFNADPTRAENKAKIEELASSMKAIGQIDAISLRHFAPAGKDPILILITGNRRVAAKRLLGETTVRATIRKYNEKDAYLANEAENASHAPVHPFYRSKRLAFIKAKFGLSDEDLAKATGASLTHVQNLLRVQHKLAPYIIEKAFKSDSVSPDVETPTMKWLIEIVALPEEEQIQAFEARYGKKPEGATAPTDDKGREDGEEKEPTKPRMRNRDAILNMRFKILKKLSEDKRAAGFAQHFLHKDYYEDARKRKVTDRDIDFATALLDWVLDAKKKCPIEFIDPREVDKRAED